MRKKSLLALPRLLATPDMVQTANSDTPKVSKSWNGRPNYQFKFPIYYRSAVFRGILVVSFFSPQAMRSGSQDSFLDLFIDRKEEKFLSYNRDERNWLTGMLKNISFPNYVYYSNRRWCTPEDEKRIIRYLHMESDNISGYHAIECYQSNIREKELQARYDRETAPWRAENKQIPPIPKGFRRWVDKVGIPNQFIYYRYERGGAKTGYCSFCEIDVPIENPKHNQEGRCCRCGHSVIFKSLGRTGFLITPKVTVYLPQKTANGFVIRMFEAWRRQFKGEHKTPEILLREIRRAYYLSDGRALSAYYYGVYKQRQVMWIKTYPCSPDYYEFGGYSSGMVYDRTFRYVDKAALARSGIESEIASGKRFDPEVFLARYNKRLILEQLKKAGLKALYDECNNYGGYRSLFLGVEPAPLTKMLGLDTYRLKRLRKCDGGYQFVIWLRYEKMRNKPIPDEVIQWMCMQHLAPDSFRFIVRRMSYTQIYNYMRRQMERYKMSASEMLTTWKDYLKMAERFNYDVNDEIVYRASKLRERHDELSDRCAQEALEGRVKQVAERFPRIDDICKALHKKYEYADKTYAIVAPSGIADILLEGDHLHHCISGNDRYFERMERHESYLLFLRKAKEPNTSYYTMEIEPDGTVRQIRTMYDRQNSDIEDAREFLRGWQKIVAERLTARDRKKSAKSRVLREKEFAQMREDQVRIHTGDLAGKLLVEVLTADLMEAA